MNSDLVPLVTSSTQSFSTDVSCVGNTAVVNIFPTGQVSDNVVNVTSDAVIDSNVDVSAIQSSFNSRPVLNESVQVDAEHREGLASDTSLLSYNGVYGENVETDKPARELGLNELVHIEARHREVISEGIASDNTLFDRGGVSD
ncbi:hypothetical protein V6N13_048692 [Hibiscus sabdariffa]